MLTITYILTLKISTNFTTVKPCETHRTGGSLNSDQCSLLCRVQRRKPSVDADKVKELRDSSLGASAIAK